MTLFICLFAINPGPKFRMPNNISPCHAIGFDTANGAQVKCLTDNKIHENHSKNG